MAKGKNLNPADAQRKAERKKELKKNKTERQKTRDFALVKKDTSSLEEEVERLEKAETDGVISASQKTQLSTIRAELARINKKKEDYVAEHPEHRKLVFRARHKKADPQADGEEGEDTKKERKIFDKHGIPRHPERSIYYDPVMNPFGVPPPGMPYMERPLRPDEVDSQAEDGSDEEEDGDDDIAMPSGPPPAKEVQANIDNEAEEDSDDDITMPEGPPPSKLPPLPPHPPPPQGYISPFPPNFLPPPPPPPPGFPVAQPMGFTSYSHNPFPHSLPPPPPGFPVPPPPPGFPPQPFGWTSLPSRSRLQSNGSMQDPLTSVPHQTFQAYRAQQALPSHPLPDKPTPVLASNQIPSTQDRAQPAGATDAGTISAPAQLRDLKKESTAFVPSTLKRKKAGGAVTSSGGISTSRINAAPEASPGDKEIGSSEAEAVRPDLLGALKSNFPAPSTRTDDAGVKKRKLDIPETKKGKDDYEKFIEEIGDILGS